MNFTKKTLFWVIVLIALSGVSFLFDKKQEEVKQVKEANLKLLPYTVNDVSEFWITNLKDNSRIGACPPWTWGARSTSCAARASSRSWAS